MTTDAEREAFEASTDASERIDERAYELFQAGISYARAALPSPQPDPVADDLAWLTYSNELRDALKAPPCLRDGCTLDDYWHAPGDGKLSYVWRDKPHRLLYDLIGVAVSCAARITSDAATIAAKDEEIERLRGDCRSYAKTLDAIAIVDATAEARITELQAEVEKLQEALNDLLTRPTDPAARLRARAALNTGESDAG